MTSDAGRARWAFPALIAGSAVIGWAPILVRIAEAQGVGPTATAFHRLAIALPILWAWMRFERTPPPARRDVFLLVAIGFFFAADLGFWHASILRTHVANATLLVCLASTFAALAGWILFRERITGLLLAGVVTALAGSGLLMVRSLMTGRRNLVGDALGLLAALFYAAYLLGIARLRARISTATAMAWSGVGATVGLLAAALLLGESMLPATPRGWLTLGALALVGQVAGQTLIAYALAHLSMAFSAVSLLVQPVVAALLSWWLFGEALAAVQFAGGALILAGIVAARIGCLPKN